MGEAALFSTDFSAKAGLLFPTLDICSTVGARCLSLGPTATRVGCLLHCPAARRQADMDWEGNFDTVRIVLKPDEVG